MQRSRRKLDAFLDWFDEMEPEHPLKIGQILKVKVNGLTARHYRLRPISYFPPIPEETARYFGQCRLHRPRTQALDNALHADSHSELPFKFTKVVRAGDEKYSQVFYGILGDIEIELLDETEKTMVYLQRRMSSFREVCLHPRCISHPRCSPSTGPVGTIWTISFERLMMVLGLASLSYRGS